jgi:uncharacterized protein (DUF302 family)
MASQVVTRRYGIRRVTDMPYDEALQRVRETLKEQGFGILTEIDVKKTMKEKLGADYSPYVILGACNPQLAHKALNAEPEIGLLLPCNVIVYDENGSTVVEAMDPVPVLSLVGNPDVEPVAAEARDRLQKAIEAM